MVSATPKLVSEKQFLQSLFKILNFSYIDGIEQIINWELKENSIVGIFKDGNKIFNFTLSPQGLEYKPVKLSQKLTNDSLHKYFHTINKSKAYITSFLINSVREDKKRNCTSSSSYPCGNTCINNKDTCRINNTKTVTSPEEIKQVIATASKISKNSDSPPKLPLESPVISPYAGALGKAGAIAAGATLIGVPATAYTSMRNNYRKNLDGSAELAVRNAVSVDVPELDDSKSNVTFAVGGFAGDAKGGERLASQLNSPDLSLKGHHVVSISNEEFDIRTPEEFAKGIQINGGDASSKQVGAKDFAVRGLAAFTRNVLQQGRNPVSVKLASQAYAYHKKYPNRQISLVGHSAGGMTAREAGEILEKVGVKTKVVAFGSPYFGLTEPTEDSITIGSRKDSVLQQTGYSVMNGVWMNSVQGHSISNYFADQEFKEFIKLHLDGASKDKDKRLDANTKRCVNGKPCGKTCIAKGIRCNIQLSTSTIAQVETLHKSLQKTTSSSPSIRGKAKTTIKPQEVQNKISLSSAAPISLVVKQGAIAGAALLGITTTSYLAQKTRYQAGFQKSAELSKEEAEQYNVPDSIQSGLRSIGEQSPDSKTIVESKYLGQEPEQITFTIGGFGGENGQEGDYLAEEVSAMFPKHHVVAVESPEFDITGKEGDRVYHPSFIKRAVGTTLGANLKEGRNVVSVRVAARAYAYHQQFPDKPINLIGQSGGTMPVREAAEILKEMGVKDVKVVGAAGPYFGLTKPTGITLQSNNDNLKKMVGFLMINPVEIKSAKGHGGYFTEENGGLKEKAVFRRKGIKTSPNAETQKYLSEYFSRDLSVNKDALSEDTSFSTFKNPQHILIILRRIIQEGYKEQIDAIFDVETNDKGIYGKFKRDTEVYDFNVSLTGKLSYVEASNLDSADVNRQDKSIIKYSDTRFNFAARLKQILSRVYTDGIDQFLDLKISNTGDIDGLFRDDDKLIEFSIKNGIIKYSLASKNKNRRNDSWLAEYFQVLRWDTRNKRTGKPKCSKGISCGSACIANNKACVVKLRNVATSIEIDLLQKAAIKLKLSLSSPTTPQHPTPPFDPLEGKSIRDLKKEASDRGIYRYSEMTTAQLKEAIKAADQDPEQQERIRKTLNKNQGLDREARKFGITGKDKPQKALLSGLKAWRQINKVAEIAGVNPSLSVAAIGTLVMGATMQQYNRARDNYRLGLSPSARTAEERARKLNVEHVQKSNITFVVGGFKSQNSTAARIADLLTSSKETKNDEWFENQNHIVEFDNKEFDIPEVTFSKRNSDGSYNPAYLGHVATKGFGQMYKNFQRHRNEDSVELASQIYAYAVKRNIDGKLGHKDKPINILAHSAGGITTNEALEILARMQPISKGAPSGRDILQQVNVVTLGTPDFGFTENVASNYRNITSEQDPFSVLPKRREKWISTVKGHEPDDYLTNSDVLEQIRQGFGYYEASAYQRERQVRRKKGQTKKTPVPTPKPNSEARATTNSDSLNILVGSCHGC